MSFKIDFCCGNPPLWSGVIAVPNGLKSHTFTVILAVFAPQPRSRHKPWKSELIAVCFWGFDRFRNMIAQGWNFIYSWAELLNLPPQLLLSERRSLNTIGLNALFPVTFRPCSLRPCWFSLLDRSSETFCSLPFSSAVLLRKFIGLSFLVLVYGWRNVEISIQYFHVRKKNSY